MAKTTAPQLEPAKLSRGDIEAAIPKLQRRLKEVENFNPEEHANENGVGLAKPIVAKIDQTLMDIFGPQSIEYGRYKIPSLLETNRYITASTDLYRFYLEAFTKGKQNAIAKLKGVIETLQEKLEEFGGPAGSGSAVSLDGVDLHPALRAACSALYNDQHYAEAVEAGCKALNAVVQVQSGKYDLSDTALMEHVFSPNNPILAFNLLGDKHDQSEQQGMMFLYKGVFLAFRNQRAHKLIKDDWKAAHGMLSTINFLMQALEQAKKAQALNPTP